MHVPEDGEGRRHVGLREREGDRGRGEGKGGRREGGGAGGKEGGGGRTGAEDTDVVPRVVMHVPEDGEGRSHVGLREREGYRGRGKGEGGRGGRWAGGREVEGAM